jgi:dihydropteroate synthase
MKKGFLGQKGPIIMGVLNVTPDSFSDGGKFDSVEKALARALEIEKEGASIIDIGGESSGPNSKYVSLEEELSRVIPLLSKLRKQTKMLISIDTYKAEVARQALELGADMINDVTALRGDPEMASVIAKYKCPIVMMYSKDRDVRTKVLAKKYTDVVLTVKKFLSERIKYAEKNGIKKSQIIIDPGMGQFVSAIPSYSFEILGRMGELKTLGLPVLIGVSRKSFLGGEMASRLDKGLAASAIAYYSGAKIFRTHDVKATNQFFICQKCN